MLRLVRSVKNNIAPINRIPPELFSLIPQHWNDDSVDENLIAMTHVCHGWRDVLIGCPLLWTRLNCADRNKTCVYIQRSKSSPLEVHLREYETPRYCLGPFIMALSHIDRVDSLIVKGRETLRGDLTECDFSRSISLRNLSIDFKCRTPPTLDSRIFNGDLSSLERLSLGGVIPNLPWRNLPKLTSFKLRNVPREETSVTRLLNFFANAPLLDSIELLYAMPETSDASPGRVVSLPSLKNFAICAGPIHSSSLLDHLSIPAGALLHLRFHFRGEDSPLPQVLPKTSENLKNTHHFTSAYLKFTSGSFSVRFNGPSGELHMYGSGRNQLGMSPERRILQSLDYFGLSRIQNLAVATYESPGFKETDVSPPYNILHAMKDLRTLFLNRCNNLPFILALDPAQTPLDHILCPKLEELILYVGHKETVNSLELVNMAKERSLRGAKLHSIVLASPGKILWEWVVLRLREHVVRVERRTWGSVPEWDSIPNDGSN